MFIDIKVVVAVINSSYMIANITPDAEMKLSSHLIITF